MTDSISIHTLDARGNVLLDVMSDEFELSSAQMLRVIRQSHTELLAMLAKKNIDYGALRSALVPSASRREACLVFDTMQIESGSYGTPAFDRILPLLGRTSSHSVLSGDLLGNSAAAQQRLKVELARSLTTANSYEYQHSTQFYLVYISNLSEGQVARIHTGLTPWEPYAGYIDCTYASWIKMAISTMLPADFILHHGVAISEHEDDYSGEDDINIRAHPFGRHGITVRSIMSIYFGLFLSYKIEHPPFPEDRDVEFSLNAVTDQPVRLLNMNVRLEPEKLGYLLREKRGSFERAGLADVDVATLSALIGERLSSNYIYNLEYNSAHKLVKFNIIIEVPVAGASARHRFTVALEYQSESHSVRVITMY